MDKDFLHRINLDCLKKETGMDLPDLASLVGLKNPKAIYKWAKSKDSDGTRPTYNDLIKLIEAGASIETLFDICYRSYIKISEKPVAFSDADISAFLQRAADALKNQKD